MKKTKDTQYLFLSANIRALQTKMIGTQALQKMISAASPEEAYKTVNDAGIGADIDYKDFESALTGWKRRPTTRRCSRFSATNTTVTI